MSVALQARYNKTYMGGDTVVPDDNGVGLPPDAGLVVDTLVDVVIEEVEDGVYRCVLACSALNHMTVTNLTPPS